MLTIRQAQIAAFSEEEVQKFENWTLVHLQRFFPKQCAALGEPRLRETIQYGIERAAHYGITDKRDVCTYIDFTIVFGRDFDTDRRFAWAGEILRRPRTPRLKIHTLLKAANQYLSRH